MQPLIVVEPATRADVLKFCNAVLYSFGAPKQTALKGETKRMDDAHRCPIAVTIGAALPMLSVCVSYDNVCVGSEAFVVPEHVRMWQKLVQEKLDVYAQLSVKAKALVQKNREEYDFV